MVSTGGQGVGQRGGLSTTDVDKVWTLYQCYGGQSGQCSKASSALCISTQTAVVLTSSLFRALLQHIRI